MNFLMTLLSLQPFQTPRARDEGYPTPQSSTAAMSPIDRAASGEEDAEVTEVQQRSGDSLSFAWDLRCFFFGISRTPPQRK